MNPIQITNGHKPRSARRELQWVERVLPNSLLVILLALLINLFAPSSTQALASGATSNSAKAGIAAAADPLLDGLVGAWTFDGDVKDTSGNANDGQLVDAAELSDDVPPVIASGKSLKLEGGHVLVPHASSLNITQAITIAAWVKPVGEEGWDGVLAKNPSDGSASNHAGNYELRIENGGRFLHFLHQQGGENDTAFQSANDSIILPDTWTHVAVTADVTSRNVVFYINGQLSQTLEQVINVDEFPTNQNPLYIGSRADLFTPFNGLLDHVLIYNKVLSPDLIAQLASPAAAKPQLSFERDGNRLRLTWTGTLQKADRIGSPWADVQGAASPTTVPMDQAAAFFRTRN